MNVADGAGTQRRAVPAPIIREKLTLEPRDVHANRTLGLARPALEAQVEHVVYLGIAEARVTQSPRHREAQHIGAATRGVLFLERRHVRRTHRPVEFLAARAEPAAHFNGARHPAVLGKIEIGGGTHGAVWSVSEVRRERRTVHDLSRVEHTGGIERVLDRPKRVVERRAEHLLGERSANEAVAMFAGQRAAELEHEVGDVVRDRAEALNALGGFQIDHWPDVQAADRRVRVHAGDRVVAMNDLQEAVDVVAEPFGRDRRVFHERERLVIALHRHRQPERGLAEAPDPRLIFRRHGPPPPAAQGGRREIALERLEARRQILGPIGVELHAEKRARVALRDATPQRVERGTFARVIEDEAVHDLDG